MKSLITQRRKYFGFTLMEVLAAMMLLAIVLPAVMKGVSVAMALASDSVRKITAAELAENRLTEVLILQEWKNGSAKGDFGSEYPDYTWNMTSSDWNSAGLKQVDVSVAWQHRGYEKEFSLTTLVYDIQQ